MSAPFLVSFPQERALKQDKQMFNGLMSNFTTHNCGEYPGHRFIPSSIGGVFIVGQYPACRFTCSGAESARRIFPLIAKLRPPI